MNKRFATIVRVGLVMILAVLIVTPADILLERLKLGWLIPLIIIGGYATYFAIGLILRDIRGRGWH